MSTRVRTPLLILRWMRNIHGHGAGMPSPACLGYTVVGDERTDRSAPLDSRFALSPAGRHLSSLYWMLSQTPSGSKKSERINYQTW